MGIHCLEVHEGGEIHEKVGHHRGLELQGVDVFDVSRLPHTIECHDNGQTHGDFRHSTMNRYRKLLSRLPAPASVR